MNESNAVTVFGGSNVKVKTLTSGNEVTRVMTRKEFKLAKKLTNADAKRAYPAYLIECGVTANGNIAALIGSNRVFAQRVTKTASGFNAVFVEAGHDRFVVREDAAEVAAEAAKKDARIAELEALLAAGAGK